MKRNNGYDNRAISNHIGCRDPNHHTNSSNDKTGSPLTVAHKYRVRHRLRAKPAEKCIHPAIRDEAEEATEYPSTGDDLQGSGYSVVTSHCVHGGVKSPNVRDEARHQ
jgi:hypothetical protein